LAVLFEFFDGIHDALVPLETDRSLVPAAFGGRRNVVNKPLKRWKADMGIAGAYRHHNRSIAANPAVWRDCDKGHGRQIRPNSECNFPPTRPTPLAR
jgi:hypothetical protein